MHVRKSCGARWPHSLHVDPPLAATTVGPNTIAEAFQDLKWVVAMDAEYKALMQNKTWRLVTPPHGKNIIDCKWVYKIKRKADGTIDRYKSSLGCKGI
jgi:hypothetical protein